MIVFNLTNEDSFRYFVKILLTVYSSNCVEEISVTSPSSVSYLF